MPPKKKINRQKMMDVNSPGCQDQLLAADNKNPMLTSVVLGRLFEICSSKDLPNFRLVSKEWYSLSLPRFRRKTVEIYELEPRKYYHWGRTRRPLKWSTLTNELDVEDRPFSSFCLLNFNFGLPTSDVPMYKNIAQFLTKYGENLRQLELQKATIYSVEAFKKAIFEDTPNLEELKLLDLQPPDHAWYNCLPDDGGFNEGGVEKVQLNLKSFCVAIDKWFPVTWRLLFAHFPKMQHLGLYGFGERVDTIVSLADTLEQVSKTNKELTVDHFKLKAKNEEHANCMRRLWQLPVTKIATLEIEMENYFGQELALLPVALLGHGSTLKKLNISNANTCWTRSHSVLPYDNFPFYQDSLLLLTDLDWNVPVCRNLHFLEQVPNLKKLSMVDPFRDIFSETDIARMETVTLPHLKKLTVLFEVHIPTRMMEMLVKVMPNVEYFQGHLLTPAFRVVCEHWTALTELKVISGFEEKKGCPRCPSARLDGLCDEGITGIVPGYRRRRYLRRPNITNLKNLECLEIESAGDISDISIWDGFMLLPHLRKLNVRLSPETCYRAFSALVDKCPRPTSNIYQADLSEYNEDFSSDCEYY